MLDMGSTRWPLKAQWLKVACWPGSIQLSLRSAGGSKMQHGLADDQESAALLGIGSLNDTHLTMSVLAMW